LLIVGHDGEAFRRNAVAFRTVAIAAEGDSWLAFFMRSQDDPTADAFGEGLLEDPSVDDFNRE